MTKLNHRKKINLMKHKTQLCSLMLLSLTACSSTIDNQKDIDAGASNQIAQSPCLKGDMEPFYIDGLWVKPHPRQQD